MRLLHCAGSATLSIFALSSCLTLRSVATSAAVLPPRQQLTVAVAPAIADVRGAIRDFNVASIPTLVAMYGGTVLDVHVGSQGDAQLHIMLERLGRVTQGDGAAALPPTEPLASPRKRPAPGACVVE